jgi:8-oxo-dGTP diphosphatase
MKTFYVGIKGVVVKNSKVLVLRANKAQGRRDVWEMPGGRINDDETIEQALVRELTEELPNIKNIKTHEILHAYRLPHDIEGDKSLVLIYYRVTADFEGSKPAISDEHVDWQWTDMDTAIELTEGHNKPALLEAFNP